MNRDLLTRSLESLMAEAGEIRDRTFGRAITYSPKVFIPLTKLCRDSCAYCTFAEPPARVATPFLEREDVLEIAHQGQQAGCIEALFTLGERPELRYAVARDWLGCRDYESTVDYLAAMAALVRDETGLLPHCNAGALSNAELGRLRPVSASQGMMLESLRSDLEAHRNAPDKTPERRLATLEAAGELAIPFTTGLLIGIGETPTDWLIALEAIAESHRRHGHVAEVIIQNFRPKPHTIMRKNEPPDAGTYLRAIAIARISLAPDIHLQAPPNLSEDFGRLIDAGIDDWGGISPVTRDHVNPERPWPAVDRLREVAERRGFQLTPRLPIHRELLNDRWIDVAMRAAIDARRARLVES